MENTTVQATNAVAAMRALPSAASPARWSGAQLAAVMGEGSPTRVAARLRSMAGVGYGCLSVTTTIGQAVSVRCDHDADHKFSTRLGPTASPPV